MSEKAALKIATVSAIQNASLIAKSAFLRLSTLGQNQAAANPMVFLSTKKKTLRRHLILQETTTQILQLLGADDAGDSRQVVGDADIGPRRSIQERVDGWQTVVSEFENH